MPSVFVAYPYDFPQDDYRGSFEAVRGDFDVVDFVFADQRITNKHILEKIISMIQEAEFSLFDVTTWNANVALELGVAIGARLDYYILFNPAMQQGDVPADLGGIDRIQYTSYGELKAGLERLMTQQFGAPEPSEKTRQAGSEVMTRFEELQSQIPEIVRAEPGLQIGGIASAVGLPIDVVQVIVRPLIGEQLATRGVKRGTRYYLADDAPPDEEPEGSRETGLLLDMLEREQRERDG
jgi:hypothetical protein